MSPSWLQPKDTNAARQFRYLWISAVIILIDQFLKILAKAKLPLYIPHRIWGDFLWLTRVRNDGAAFSLSLGSPLVNRFFFIGMTILAIGFVVYLILRSNNKLQLISLSMIIGGAIGNLIDRVLFGYVTDFIDVNFPNLIMERWPVFNIADSSIVIAMGLLILDMIIKRNPNELMQAKQTPNPDKSI